jgi:hypothetical protein
MQEPQRRIVVDDAEAERLREKGEAAVEIARVEIDVDDLARPVRLVGGIGMVGGAADEGEVAAVGILAAEAVAAAGDGDIPRRRRLAAGRRDLRMQSIDRFAVGDVENDAHHGGLRAAVQPDHVVIARGAAEIARVVSRLDRREVPHAFVKPRRLLQIAGDQIDAAHAADEARHLYDPPRSFFTCAPALPKSICPAKRCLSAAMVRPMSLSVAASSSLISAEIAEAASKSDICFGK